MRKEEQTEMRYSAIQRRENSIVVQDMSFGGVTFEIHRKKKREAWH